MEIKLFRKKLSQIKIVDKNQKGFMRQNCQKISVTIHAEKMCTLCRLLTPLLLREIFEISEEDILNSPCKRKFSWIHCLISKIFLGASPPDPQFFNDIYMGGLGGGAL